MLPSAILLLRKLRCAKSLHAGQLPLCCVLHEKYFGNFAVSRCEGTPKRDRRPRISQRARLEPRTAGSIRLGLAGEKPRPPPRDPNSPALGSRDAVSPRPLPAPAAYS